MWCSRTVKGTAAQVGDGRVTAGRYPACEPLRNQPIASINKKVGEAILNFLELQGGEITGVGVFGLVFFFFSLCPVSGETLSTQGIFSLFITS